MSERASTTTKALHGGERLGITRAAIGDGALFAASSSGSAKVAGQRADKERKRLRRVFAPRPTHNQTKGGIGYATVGIIETRPSLSQGLFTEENCEDRSKTYNR